MTSPLLPFQQIKLWGAPYHGKVQSGLLAKSNSGQMVYPQPTSGNTVLYKHPTTPAVVRDVNELAADVIDGREWRDYAIIAGGGQLHGQEIGAAWLHRDELGRMWRITLIPTVSTAIIVLSCKQFGTVGISEQDSIGEVLINADVTVSESTSINSIQLMDVKPDGSQCAVKILDGFQHALITIDLSGLGTLEDASAGVAMVDSLKTLTESWITATLQIPSTSVHYDKSPAQTTTHFPPILEDVGSGCMGEHYISEIDNFGQNNVHLIYGNSAVYDGQISEKESIYYDWAFYSKSGDINIVGVVKNDTSENFSKDDDVLPSSGALDAIQIWSSGTPPFCVFNGFTSSGTMLHHFIQRAGLRTTSKIEITLNDVAIESLEVIMSEITTTTTDTLTDFPTPTNGIPVNHPSISAVDQSKITVNGSVIRDEPTFIFGVVFPYSASVFVRGLSLQAIPNGSVLPDIYAKMMTNKLMATYTHNQPVSDYTYYDHVGADGVDNAVITKPNQDSEFASYQPETGEIVRNQDGPVCFV